MLIELLLLIVCIAVGSFLGVVPALIVVRALNRRSGAHLVDRPHAVSSRGNYVNYPQSGR